VRYPWALDLARVVATAAAVVDLTSDWETVAKGTVPNPWATLIDGPDAAVPATMQRLGYPTRATFAGLTGFVHHTGQRISILCHPLWTEAHIAFRQAKTAAEQSHQGATVIRLNPFRLLRRPADYV
jgi:hypothetical protein